MTDLIRIATRESALALWQANHVKHLLEQAHPSLDVKILGMTTEGDRNKQSPLSQIGGKGVFVKELEQALLNGDAEIAVHSMKDVPSELPPGLQITAMCQREDPRDAFVSKLYSGLADMPAGASIGSSSLRRRLQLKLTRDDIRYIELRGNVDTRLRKLAQGDYDGIILATAGLIRLGLASEITEVIDTLISIPAAGQGAVGIESRADAQGVNQLLAAINHKDTFDCVSCERTISISLGANCNLPIAAFAELDGDQMRLSTYVSDVSGETYIKRSGVAQRDDSIAMAKRLVEELIQAGANKLIASHD